MTTIEAVTGGLRVSWVKPDSNSDEITAYRVEALLPSGLWSEICDGSRAVVVTSQGCIIPMSTFWDGATYKKNYGDLVQFRVTAFNVNGWGKSSLPNTTGARVLTVPRTMNRPLRDTRTSDQ